MQVKKRYDEKAKKKMRPDAKIKFKNKDLNTISISYIISFEHTQKKIVVLFPDGISQLGDDTMRNFHDDGTIRKDFPLIWTLNYIRSDHIVSCEYSEVSLGEK